MTSGEWAGWAQAIAGMFTFGAAALAVKAAYHAPKAAAGFAERLRRDSQREDEDRRQRLWIFATLMQHRAQIANFNAVSALNLIDVVYRDEREVREAWRSFYRSTLEDSQGIKIVERYLQILQAMARALGLNDQITIHDIETCYYPTALGRFDEAAWLEAMDKLQRFRPPEPPSGS